MRPIPLRALALCLTALLSWCAGLQASAILAAPGNALPASCAPGMTQDLWWNDDALQEAVAAILLSQDHGDAIHVSPASSRIVPYFANYAALGLVSAYRLELIDGSGLERVRRWLEWYARHMDPETGVITDYTGRHPVYASTRDYDSSDAYAGTFLTAVWAWYAASRDAAGLRALWPAVELAVHAVALTQEEDGLTWAKPDYRVKYLVDNVEVWLGLHAAALIAAELGEDVQAARWKELADRTRRGIENLYRGEGVPYLASSIGNSGALNLRLERLYPDGLANFAYLAVLGQAGVAEHTGLFDVVWNRFYGSELPDADGAMHVWAAQAACVIGDAQAFAKVIAAAGDAAAHRAQAHSLASLLRIAAALKGHPLWY